MLILLILPALMTTSALDARYAEVLQAHERLQSLLAALPILTAYGLIDEQIVPLIVALVAAILSTGLAAANTSTSSS
jgi:hypothetical protein